ncbi:hypothetical protein F9K50_05565 [bacterium]|nr:MAG: hypothetical protein F9K50_05565 [bacterium]
MKLLGKILRAPPLHFLAIGAALFGLQQGWEARRPEVSPSPREELVISRAQIGRIKRDIQAQTGAPASPAQIQAGIQDAIDEEILYRQALVMGLDRSNPSVRRRLVEAARFVSEDPTVEEGSLYRRALELGLDRRDEVVRRILVSAVRLIAQQVPTPEEPAMVHREELEKYLQEHPAAFRIPRRYTFQQIFFSRDRRRGQGPRDAASLRRDLIAQRLAPRQAMEAGDPFLHGRRFAGVEALALRRAFGAGFAAALASLQAGSWSLPIPSSYGWHLVWLEQIQGEELPPLIAVANQVQNAILAERKERRLQNTLKELRARYQIRVEGAEPYAASSTGGGRPR